jgi:hypothetical protein
MPSPMKLYALCPVSNKRIVEQASRMNGAFTVFLLVLFAATQSILPVLFLVIDFAARATNRLNFSLLAIASARLVRFFSWEKKFINAGPKLFAARIGLTCSSLTLLAYLVHFYWIAYAVASVLGIFSFLEAVMGICVACELYPFVYRLVYKNRMQEN